ncbi:MAG: caspase family protein, partial [Moorea sp. SIO2B7]|nr:caspase family protein [Moorena sp. SIO2B7]
MARYALIIGIREYQSFNPLPKTTTDAEAVAQLLEKHGNFQEVKRLPARWNQYQNCYEIAARGVTGRELGETLNTFLLKQATKGDALIYFTGHGITVSDNLGQQSGYLATSDCWLEWDNQRIVGQFKGISLDSFNNIIRASNLSSLVVLLDCCHSGHFLEQNLIKQTLTAFNSQQDYYLISASRGFEEAYVGEEHSIFSGALLQGLSPENAGSDGQISGDRLFDHIQRKLRQSGQEPIRLGWGSSITLVSYPQVELQKSDITFNQDNPYLGLHAFESEQEQYFCGREQGIRALLERLTNNRFLTIIGPSGCGK